MFSTLQLHNAMRTAWSGQPTRWPSPSAATRSLGAATAAAVGLCADEGGFDVPGRSGRDVDRPHTAAACSWSAVQGQKAISPFRVASALNWERRHRGSNDVRCHARYPAAMTCSDTWPGRSGRGYLLGFKRDVLFQMYLKTVCFRGAQAFGNLSSNGGGFVYSAKYPCF
jgi:hypothetical protein